MLSLHNVGYEVGSREVFSGVSFSVNKGDKIGLVGKNGIGKTTLLNIIAGSVEPTQGQVTYGNYEVGILPQDLRGWLDSSVYSFIETVTGVSSVRESFEKSTASLKSDTSEKALLIYADALDKLTKFEVASFESNLHQALAIAGISDIDVDNELGKFSGGQRTRIALAAILASKHDVILLDEPTNNLDHKGIVVLEKFIGNSNAAFVMVSHDRKFLRNATSKIIELVGDKGVEHYGLGYDEYIESRQAAREAQVKRYEEYETEKKRLARAARDARVRANSAAHGSNKSDNDKLTANFRREKAASGLSKAANAMTSRLDHLDQPDEPQEEVSLNFLFKEANRKKGSLITVNNLTISHGDSFTAGPLSLHLRAGDRLAIIGENGVGKTSLLKAMMSKVNHNDETVRTGRDVKALFIDQDQTAPLPDATALDNLSLLAPELEVHDAINLLLRFSIDKNVIFNTPVRSMSGGERAKLLLAAVAATGVDLLVMDEPTNNLDIPTVEALERALSTYDGGLIVVSHDREFLDNLNITQRIPI